MSVTTPTAPPRAIGRPRDLRTLWRVLIAVTLPIGPILVLLVRGIMPYWTSDDIPTMVAKSVADPGTLTAMTWIGVFIVPPLVASLLAIGYVARRGAPVLATLGVTLSFVSYTIWFAGGNVDLTVAALNDKGFDATTITRVVDASVSHPAASLSTVVWVIGHIIGAVLLGIALLRSRVVPRWVAIAMIVSQPMHLVAAVIVPSRLLDLTLGWGLTTVAFAAVAVVILQMSNDDWDAAPTRTR
jgi:hypothetical protein